MSNDYQYRGRRTSSNSQGKILYLAFIVIALMLMVSLIGTLKFLGDINDLENQNIELELQRTTANTELDILRTLNPFQVEGDKIITEAVNTMSLYPGWVTRVYPIPENIEEIYSMMDLGSFILDETLFTLTSHKSYGISHPNTALYRLNALLPTYVKGRHQVGVQLQLTDAVKKVMEKTINDATCFVRVEVAQKRIIDTRMKIMNNRAPEKILTGEVNLDTGIHPISAIFYCDEKSEISSDNIVISLSFRNPGDYNLSNNRNSVYHIYKSDFRPKA